ncbi:MAG: hypothetical protein HKP27_14950, partial [Myxococcales bacterium]|nr:hypothetical protein [Myxococcales bacterium]
LMLVGAAETHAAVPETEFCAVGRGPTSAANADGWVATISRAGVVTTHAVTGLVDPYDCVVDPSNGDIVFVDEGANGSGTNGRLLRLDTATATLTTLSANLINPRGVTMVADGTIYVVDSGANTGTGATDGALYAYAAGTLTRLDTGGVALIDPRDVDVDPHPFTTGTLGIHVITLDRTGRIDRVPLAGGNVTTVSAATGSNVWYGLEIGPYGKYFLTDRNGNDIVRFDRDTGNRTIIGNSGNRPVHLAIDYETADLFVADDSTDDLFRISPSAYVGGPGLSVFVADVNLPANPTGIGHASRRPSNLPSANLGMPTRRSPAPGAGLTVIGPTLSNVNGDVEREISIFIEVADFLDPLRIRIFDADNNNGYDASSAGGFDSSYTYALTDPAGTTLSSVTIPAGGRPDLDQRIATLNAGNSLTVGGPGVPVTAAGLYRLRITANNNDDFNQLGVWVEGRHAYSFQATFGALEGFASGVAPFSTSLDPARFYPLFDRGCEYTNSNYDMDSRAGTSLTAVTREGESVGLTLSGFTVHVEDTVDPNPGGGAPASRETDYGPHRFETTITPQKFGNINIASLRVADYHGYVNGGAASPPLIVPPGNVAANPTPSLRQSPGPAYPQAPFGPSDNTFLRMYFPRYDDVVGTVPWAATAPPHTPYLSHAITPLSGDPPTVGSASRYLVQVSVVNPDPVNATGSFRLTAPVPAPTLYVDSGPAVSGGATATGGASVTTCSAPCSGNIDATWLGGIPAGSIQTLSYAVEITPTSAGQRLYLTGGPEFRGGGATPAPNPASLGGGFPGTLASFTPAWSSAIFPRTESLGPLCDLSVVEGTVTPVAVDLAFFEATPGDGEVLLEWETASEFENLGFRVLRRLPGEAQYRLLHSDLILGRGTTDLSARYAFIDRSAPNGVTASYLLEDIELDGDTTPHGPVSARPASGAAPLVFDPAAYAASGADIADEGAEASLPGIDENAGTSAAPESGGARTEPLAPDFEISSETPSEVRVALTLPAPSLARVRRGGRDFTEVSVEGFDTTLLAGAPALPARTYWVETHEAAFIDLSFEGSAGPDLELEAQVLPVPTISERDGRIEYDHRPEHPAYLGFEAYPAQAVSLVGTVRLEDGRQLVGIRVRPVQVGAGIQTLSWFREFEVTLRLRGSSGSESLVADTLSSEIAAAQGIKIEVDDSGLFAVTGADLVAAGLSAGLDPRRLHVASKGVPVSARFDGAWDGVLDLDDTLYFYAEPREDRYSDRQVFYVFPSEVLAPRLAEIDAAPSGALREGASTRALTRFEPQTVYLPGILNGEGDNYVGPFVFSTAETSVLRAPAATTGPAQLRIKLRGGTTFPDVPDDHHVEVQVAPGTSSEVRLDVRFDGTDAFEASLELDHDVAKSGSVPVVVEPQFDSGAPFDLIYIDSFELHYRRAIGLVGDDAGQLVFGADASGPHRITGLARPKDAVLWDVTETEIPRALGGVQLEEAALTVQLEAGHRYLIAEGDAAKTPFSLARQIPSDWTDPGARHGADWIAIGHGSLLPALEELAAHRERQGLATELIDIEDIYDEASSGRASPLAIREFLRRIASHWQPVPRYVLLAGEANYDYRDHLGGAAPNLVPTLLVDTTFVEAASDSAVADIAGDDGAPDFAIGRIPARTAEELADTIEKVIAYENRDTAGETWTRSLLLVADDGVGAEAPNEAQEFESILDTVAASAPGGLFDERVVLRDLPDANEGEDANAAIRDALVRGQILTTYVGHGGARFWSDELIFGADDWDTLENVHWPVFLVLNCLNGFFDAPNEEAFAEVALAAPQRGAIAVVSSTTVSSIHGQASLAKSFSERLLGENVHRVGDALQQAVQSMAGEPGAGDVIATFVLIGDPATRIALPTVPVADAGSDREIELAASVQLDGRASRADGSGPVDYRWRIAEGPSGGRIIDSRDPTRPFFRASVAGSYQIELVVAQDGVESAPARVQLQVNPGSPRLGCAPGGSSPNGPQNAALDWIYFALPILISRRAVRRMRRERPSSGRGAT